MRPRDPTAEIDRSKWRAPPIFDLVKNAGGVDDAEMFRTFNMGIGLIAVVPDAELGSAATALITRLGDKSRVGLRGAKHLANLTLTY